MKQHLKSLLRLACLSIIVAALQSCVNDEPEVAPVENGSLEKLIEGGRYRTVEDAYRIAFEAMSMLDDVPQEKSRGLIRMPDYRTPVKVIRAPRSRSVVGDTLMYVVNYADSMGFAVISAVKGTPELIAVTMRGSYDPANPGDNPGFNMYMDAATRMLSVGPSVIDTTTAWKPGDSLSIIKPRIYEKTVRDTVWINRVANRVKVNWRQGFEEGQLCPNGIAGCAPLAVAMMMTGFRYPDEILIHNTGKGMPLNWDLICNHRKWGYNRYFKERCNDCDSQTHRVISMLCRELGYRMNSTYREDETSTKYYMVYEIMHTLGYKNISKVDQISPLCISNSLNSNTILLMKGMNPILGGHMWICDAVKHYKICSSYYQSYDAGKTWILKSKDYGPDVAYNFFNWGWDGNNNGYFLDLDFRSGSMAANHFSSDVGYIEVRHLNY